MTLKPCPFCGNTNIVRSDDNYGCFWTICDDCGACTGESGIRSQEEADERWNRRTPSPAPEGAAEPPVAWWSGGEYGGGDEHGRLSLGTFTEHEDTWHDIPVYAGWNNEGKPSRNEPPAALAAVPQAAEPKQRGHLGSTPWGEIDDH